MSKTTLEKVFSNKYVQLAALAAGGLALLRNWKKDSVSGVGRVSKVWNLSELVEACEELAEELQTNCEREDYPQYGWTNISFYTDKFGGTYVNLHYDHNTGVVTNWYGSEYAYEVNSKKFLRSLVKRELYRELKDRDLDYIYEMINAEY